MDDDFIPIVLAITIVLGLFVGGMLAGAYSVKTEAFERGHMVQCIGKRGYHWECE